MAQVPGVPSPSVAPNGPAAPGIDVRANPEAFGAGVAQSLTDLGRSTSQAGDILQQHALTLQGLQNKADADNGYVDFGTFANQKNLEYQDQKRGGDALPALNNYVDEIAKKRQEIQGKLNPAAARFFEADSRRLLTNMIGEMSRHAAAEQKKYVIGSSEARASAAADLAAQNPGNEAFLSDAKRTIANEAQYRAHMMGLGPEMGEQYIRGEMSKLHASVITQLANDDPIAANNYFEKNKGDMNEATIRTMDSFLHTRTQPYIAATIADAIATGHTAANGPVEGAMRADPGGYIRRMIGGDATITSTVRSPEHNAEVGGVPTSEHMAQNGFAIDFVPKGMTTAEAAAKLKASNTGAHQILDEGDHVHIGWKNGGAPSSGVNIAAATNLQELESMRKVGLDQVDATIDKYYNGDPMLKAQAESRFDAQYSRRYGALKAQSDAAHQTVQAALIPDDPNNTITDMETLMRQPGVATSWGYLTPAEQTSVVKQLKRNAHPTMGDLTPQQLENYQAVEGVRASRPTDFANMNVLTDPLTESLPMPMKKKIVDEQMKIRSGQPSNTTEQRALTWAKPYLDQADFPKNDAGHLDVTSKEYNAFLGGLVNQVRAYHDIYKRDPDVEAVRAMTANLLINKRYQSPDASNLVPGVPNDFVGKIQIEALRRGIKAPSGRMGLTPEQIQSAYRSAYRGR